MSEEEDIVSINLSTYVLDILEVALCLPTEVLDKLKPAKKGIYLFNSIKPILDLEDKKYFFEDGKRVLKLEDVKSSNSYILDGRGNIIITDKRIKKIKNILLDEPNLPVVAVEFISKRIEEFLLNNTLSNKEFNYIKSTMLLKDITDPDNICNVVDTWINDVYENISNFINGDIYNIYDIIERGSILVINKKCDYRIAEYYKLKRELFKTNN